MSVASACESADSLRSTNGPHAHKRSVPAGSPHFSSLRIEQNDVASGPIDAQLPRNAQSPEHYPHGAAHDTAHRTANQHSAPYMSPPGPPSLLSFGAGHLDTLAGAAGRYPRAHPWSHSLCCRDWHNLGLGPTRRGEAPHPRAPPILLALQRDTPRLSTARHAWPLLRRPLLARQSHRPTRCASLSRRALSTAPQQSWWLG